MSSFVEVAPYYDMLMRDVPYRSWARYVQQLYERRHLRPKRALDLACGTGNLTEHLAKAGLDMVGVDISAPMIEEARRKAAQKKLPIQYEVQDAAVMAIDGPPFDLCVSLFDSLNYITDPVRLRAALHRVAAHLRPGGLFIFDVNSVFALENGFFDQENTDTQDRLRYVWRSEYDAEARLCTVEMRFFLRSSRGVDEEFRETHVQFAYTEDELWAWLGDAGFDDIETFHAYSLYPVRETTDRIFFVAAKSTG